MASESFLFFTSDSEYGDDKRKKKGKEMIGSEWSGDPMKRDGMRLFNDIEEERG